jgi:hypothetical protein
MLCPWILENKMGLFLALSGVIDANPEQVGHILKDFAISRSGDLEFAEGNTDQPNIGIITQSEPNTSILYPNHFGEWDDASQYISRTLNKSVFSFHIHDGDLWMFILFQNGIDVARFNPIPEYWAKLDPEEKAKWRGDAAFIARLIPSITPDSITKYFVEWNNLPMENLLRAYSDDEFTIGNCWQMCDFMKRIGLEFPVGAKGEVLGNTFKMWTKKLRIERAVHVKRAPIKPWWKFW